jgi:hypothetical protein
MRKLAARRPSATFGEFPFRVGIPQGFRFLFGRVKVRIGGRISGLVNPNRKGRELVIEISNGLDSRGGKDLTGSSLLLLVCQMIPEEEKGRYSIRIFLLFLCGKRPSLIQRLQIV